MAHASKWGKGECATWALDKHKYHTMELCTIAILCCTRTDSHDTAAAAREYLRID
jgi:hypothetical protein